MYASGLSDLASLTCSTYPGKIAFTPVAGLLQNARNTATVCIWLVTVSCLSSLTLTLLDSSTLCAQAEPQPGQLWQAAYH